MELFKVISYTLTGEWPNEEKKLQSSKLVRAVNPVFTAYNLRSNRLLDDHQIVKVLDKDRTPKAVKVYDIETDDTHSFIANNVIVHNSEGHALVKTGKWKDWDGKERPFSWDMLNAGMKRWKERFWGVGKWIDAVPDAVRMAGSVATNLFGRERHFGGQLTQKNDYERGAAEREAINFFIQSVAASITNRTLIEIDRLLTLHDIPETDICLINTVHDSIAYEVADHLAEWFQEVVNIISSRVIEELGSSFKIDLGAGPNWAAAELAA